MVTEDSKPTGSVSSCCTGPGEPSSRPLPHLKYIYFYILFYQDRGNTPSNNTTSPLCLECYWETRSLFVPNSLSVQMSAWGGLLFSTSQLAAIPLFKAWPSLYHKAHTSILQVHFLDSRSTEGRNACLCV